MVKSTRHSVGQLDYEIILVDGGSTDGTIEWCNQQEDIRLIEQGELLGAVRAFNAGAYASRGEYVVLANDDIRFIDRSIMRAFFFMEEFKEVGVGCFYQDRGGKGWHVERMPAVAPSGTQISIYYGQVCIVPRWLGDEVGWWGDYLHTYGGDNELSANVLERGYDVVPIDRVHIHDMKVEDELRIINKGDPSTLTKGAMHPDSRKWYDKWTRDNHTGPRIPRVSNATEHSSERKPRIFYAPIYEPGHALQRTTKVGLREALGKVGLVVECDYVQDGLNELKKMACDICPDVFVLQIQDANTFNSEIIRDLKYDHPDAVFVSWNGDYHPDNLYDSAYIEMMKEFDIAGHAIAGKVKELYEAHGINWFYWQIGYEDAESTKVTKRHDVVFLGNGYSKSRRGLAQFLNSLQRVANVNIGMYGDWSTEIRSYRSTLYDFDAGKETYMASKIAISDQQWPDAEGYVSNRLFQALAAGGCLVLQQWFEGMEEYLGLHDKIHLRVWRDLEELGELISYYADSRNEDERRLISIAGNKFMLKNHSFDVRVRELFDALQSDRCQHSNTSLLRV
jgi:glycosyltransferase involved in cell wall biosynthesis